MSTLCNATEWDCKEERCRIFLVVEVDGEEKQICGGNGSARGDVVIRGRRVKIDLNWIGRLPQVSCDFYQI